MPKHVCPNFFHGEGGRGACFVEISPGEAEGAALLIAGWSCVIVHQKEIPISWLSELLAIATAHKGGIPGFLAEQPNWDSYALQLDPPRDGDDRVPDGDGGSGA